MKRFLQASLAALLRWARHHDAAASIHALSARGLLTIGPHTYGMPIIRSYPGSERKVTIGAYTSIAPGVQIITGGIHPTDWVSTYPFRIMLDMPGARTDGMPISHGDVTIGSDVWLGTDAMIMSGVTIGDGAVVAARSVVTHDVAPYTVAAGCPARRLRDRFPPDVIERLLRIRWWDWDEARIRAAMPLLSSPRLDEFLKTYDSCNEVERCQ